MPLVEPLSALRPRLERLSRSTLLALPKEGLGELLSNKTKGKENMNSLFGLNVVTSPLAVSITYKVKPWPIKKKRRSWKVERVEEPCAYLIDKDAFSLFGGSGQVIVLHPSVMAELQSFW